MVVPMTSGGSGESAHQPHDGLFRRGFGDPKHAGSELRSVLSAEVAAHIDLEHLEPVAASFVDDYLSQVHSDLLFRTTFDGDDAYLYFLIEHQSSPDDLMAFRMLRYQVRIWERHLKTEPTTSGKTGLPMIVPVVLYQGHRRWTAPTDIADIIKVSDHAATAFADLLPHVRYILDDLTVVDEAAMRARPLTPAARIAALLLGPASKDADVTTTLRASLDDWQTVADTEPALLVVFFTYLLIVGETQADDITHFAAQLGQEAKEAAVTTAQRLRQEGIEQGISQGISLGQSQLLVAMLEARFGELDNDTRLRIEHATASQIADWSTRFARGANSISAVVD